MLYGVLDVTNICVMGMCTILTTNAIMPIIQAPIAVACNVFLNSAGALEGCVRRIKESRVTYGASKNAWE